MHELYKLKDMLMKELEDYGSKGELSAGSLDVIDKLAHTTKNVCKILEEYDEGGSQRSYMDGGSQRGYANEGGSYNRGGSYRRSNMGGSYRRDSRGRYANEGGYSRDGDMIAELRELMQDAPDERTRQEFQRFISRLEVA